MNERRSLIKTWAMRGTLHLLSAEQLPLVVAARGVRQAYRRPYIHAYGPTTGADFARWWGTEPAAGNRVVNVLAPELTAIDVEGWQAWALASDIDDLTAAKPLTD